MFFFFAFRGEDIKVTIAFSYPQPYIAWIVWAVDFVAKLIRCVKGFTSIFVLIYIETSITEDVHLLGATWLWSRFH